jgi:hypothetical protein
MYVLRKMIEHGLRQASFTDDDCYFCSLSSRTIVYKGQLTPEQVRGARLVPKALCARLSLDVMQLAAAGVARPPGQGATGRPLPPQQPAGPASCRA